MAKKLTLGKKKLVVLQAICSMPKEQRQAVLRKADTALIRCICECALNILQGTVDLKQQEKQKLKRHAQVLRKLASPNSNLQQKKKIIVQKGGFLPLFLAPILGTLLSNLISN